MAVDKEYRGHALLKDAMARTVNAAQRMVRPLCWSMQLIERPFRSLFRDAVIE